MIRVHHLRVGRPIFTLWLVEELGLDYELVLYDRDPKTFRAPPELKAAHPLGKSPVIEDGGIVLAESAAIAIWLIERYGADSGLGPDADDPAARARYLEWLHYPEGSAFAPLLITLLLSREEGSAPRIERFAAGEVTLHLDHIEASLGETGFILGDRLRGPDFGVAYIVQMAERLKVLGDRPRSRAYLERATGRPAFQRALARAGA